MSRFVFFEVAPFERPLLEAVTFGDALLTLWPEALDEQTAARAAEAEVISVSVYSPISKEILSKLPRLKFLVTRSTGYDHIDVAACRKQGVQVSYVPGYGANTVAEHAFALLFSLARRLPVALQRARALDFTIADLAGFDLRGKTLGIIGVGRIGLHAMRIGRGIGMRLVGHDPREDQALAAAEGFQYVTLEQLLRLSDVVMIHAALTTETFHLIDRDALRLMKRSGVLINTARGGIVDTEALLEALDAQALAGAGLDVFEGEESVKAGTGALVRNPTPQALRHLALYHALVRRDNVLLTPHLAFLTQEAISRRAQATIESIRAYLAGTPIDLVPA